LDAGKWQAVVDFHHFDSTVAELLSYLVTYSFALFAGLDALTRHAQGFVWMAGGVGSSHFDNDIKDDVKAVSDRGIAVDICRWWRMVCSENETIKLLLISGNGQT